MNTGLTSFLLIALIVFAQVPAQLKNGFKSIMFPAPEEIEVSVIEESTANRLFREFKFNKEIPFNYPLEGCYARAHAMARMAEEQGITMGKAFAEGTLRAQTDLPSYPTVRWGWHVAPVAYIKKGQSEPELAVFDPSLFDRPVTVEEWKSKMLHDSGNPGDLKPSIDELYFGSRYQYGPNDDEGYQSRWSARNLRSMQRTLEDYLPLQDHPKPVPRNMFRGSGRTSEGVK